MLHLIIGRIGSGKTEKMYSIINSLADCGGEDILLIVPEQYSFETEKNIITTLGAEKADGIDVFSFTFLSKYLLKQFGSFGKPELDDSVRAVLMSLAVENVKDELHLYSKAKYSQGFITDMLGMLKEFRQCSISSEQLLSSSKELPDGVLKNKLYELSLISKAYDSVTEQSFFDEETSMDKLHELIKNISWFDSRTVFIDGFTGFTAQELMIIGDILPRCKDVYITVCADKVTGLRDSHSVFAHTRRTAAKLYKINSKCMTSGVDVIKTDCGAHFESDELDYLEKNLYEPDYEEYRGNAHNIKIFAADDLYNECDAVAAEIKRLISENGYRCRDIAVVARDAASYERPFKSALKKYGVPVFIDKRRPVITQPLISFTSAALKIASDGFDIESIMRLLKTELTDIDDDDIALLENYAVMWNISGTKWLDDFTGHPDGLGNEMLEKDCETLQKINSVRRRAVAPLAKLKNALKDSDGKACAEAVYRLLSDFNAQENLKNLAVSLRDDGEYELAQEQNRIWEILVRILDSLADCLGGVRLSAKRFSELFGVMASRFSAGAIPSGLDETVFGEADRVKLSNPRVVFALGVSEGVFPFVQTNKKVLSLGERQKLRDLGLDLSQSPEEEAAKERFTAYSVLCAPSEKLYVSYPLKTLTGAQNAESELVYQITRLFRDVKPVSPQADGALGFVRSKKSAFEIMARRWGENDSLETALKQSFESDAEYKDRLRALKRCAEKQPFKIEDAKTATALFGKDMYISATRAETYFKCPFEYFCKFGIKAQPKKTAQLDPMKKGTVIHYVLEILIKTYGSVKLCEMSAEELDECVMGILSSYFESNMTVQDSDSERFNFLYQNLGKTVCEVAKRLVFEFSHSDFEPVDFELPIDNDSEVKPIEITLSDGGTIRLKGSVDRVDMMKTDDKTFVRVVDYKSGGKNFSLSDVFFGLNMQMLIYLFSIWKNGTGKYADITPAGVLYMPVKAAPSNVPRETGDDELMAIQMKEYRMNGLVLDDSRAITGMDNSGGGLLIPVSLDKKSGKFKGSLIGLKEMTLLSDKLESILKEMGDMLHSGRIEADPVFSQLSTSAYRDACEYCEYKSVCGFESDDPAREIIKYTDEQCFNFLREGECDASMDKGSVKSD